MSRSSGHDWMEIAAKLGFRHLARCIDWCPHRKPDSNRVSLRSILSGAMAQLSKPPCTRQARMIG